MAVADSGAVTKEPPMPMPAEPWSDHPTLSDADRQTLSGVARDSIGYGLGFDRPLPVDPSEYAAHFRRPTATFVTLQIDEKLRGCIGALKATRPLVVDVSEHAFAAAFRDPRFPPVTHDEKPDLGIHIAILNPPVPINVRSKEDLLRQIRPGIDGLIIDDGPHRATFLPSVWDHLPDPERFVDQLMLKAGLSTSNWTNTIKVSRYTTHDVS